MQMVIASWKSMGSNEGRQTNRETRVFGEEGRLDLIFAVYRHHRSAIHWVFGFLFLLVSAFLFVDIAGIAFARIGFTRIEFTGILFLTLVGSFFNVPVKRVVTSRPVVEVSEVRIFWLTYRIPQIVQRQQITVIAVNIGGAFIPVAVSAYLLASHLAIIPLALIGVVVCSLVIHLVARPVEGVGIVTPLFVPPLVAALVSILLFPASPVGAGITAYVSGTLGALIGADLSNLAEIQKLGAPVASIGGAGTFDGIFLTGLIAVLLVTLL